MTDRFGRRWPQDRDQRSQSVKGVSNCSRNVNDDDDGQLAASPTYNECQNANPEPLAILAREE